MARTLNRLSARAAQTLKAAGLHADGGGLYLRIDTAGSKRWVFIYQWQRKRTEMGLGSATAVSVKDARMARDEARKLLGAGKNPVVERRLAPPPTVTTFGDMADQWERVRKAGWTSETTQARWKRILEHHLKPLRSLPVDAIDTRLVEETLKPIWESIPDMAPRARGGIEEILDMAKVRGLRTGDNPARWKGHLEHLLSTPQKLTRGHHPAMPYDDVPTLVAKLRAQPLVSARMVEFTILTVARPTEAREAVRPELEMARSLWIVPAKRMKEGREHRVPLSSAAVSLVEEMEADGPYLFPGTKDGRPLSNMTGAKLMTALGAGAYTVHGFRSSFRDWVTEQTDFPGSLAEAALAHLSGDEVERAYRRGDALEKRRDLMEAWAAFLARPRHETA